MGFRRDSDALLRQRHLKTKYSHPDNAYQWKEFFDAGDMERTKMRAQQDGESKATIESYQGYKRESVLNFIKDIGGCVLKRTPDGNFLIFSKKDQEDDDLLPASENLVHICKEQLKTDKAYAEYQMHALETKLLVAEQRKVSLKAQNEETDQEIIDARKELTHFRATLDRKNACPEKYPVCQAANCLVESCAAVENEACPSLKPAENKFVDPASGYNALCGVDGTCKPCTDHWEGLKEKIDKEAEEKAAETLAVEEERVPSPVPVTKQLPVTTRADSILDFPESGNRKLGAVPQEEASDEAKGLAVEEDKVAKELAVDRNEAAKRLAVDRNEAAKRHGSKTSFEAWKEPHKKDEELVPLEPLPETPEETQEKAHRLVLEYPEEDLAAAERQVRNWSDLSWSRKLSELGRLKEERRAAAHKKEREEKHIFADYSLTGEQAKQQVQAYPEKVQAAVAAQEKQWPVSSWNWKLAAIKWHEAHKPISG
jgi:hypothetical protein